MVREPKSFIIGRKPDLKALKGNIIFIILDNKQTCSFLQRETLSLSSKVFHYTNILEKIVRNKSSQCLYKQDMQKQRRPREQSPNTDPTCSNQVLITYVEILPSCDQHVKFISVATENIELSR